MPQDGGVSRRLLLVGGMAAGGAAVLAKLPGGTPSAATQVLPVVLERQPRRTPPAVDGGDAPDPEPARVHDLVLAGGRVIDPATGFDAPADVGIDGGTVTTIARLENGTRLKGRTRHDVGGRVVAPGFIDLLSYDPNPYGAWFKVADGVTTTLGMHGLSAPAGEWFSRWDAAPPPVHYGGAFDHAFHRAELGVGVTEAAGRGEVAELVGRAERDLAAGFAGVHVELEYTPGVERRELRAMADAAAAAGVPLYAHGRYSDDTEPGTNAETLRELLAVTEAAGCPLHVEHLPSTGGTFTMAASLTALGRAREAGRDVTACMYPYDFWATYLGSTRFADGWQERFRISYEDLVVPGTGERLDAASFERERADNTLVAAMAIPEADVVAALRSPFVLLGSDAVLEEGDNNHPRAAGTFSRVLGRYVREQGVLDLRSALAKMTILPAARLQGAVPAFARKGRLQAGADADVTVFDPAVVADRATLADPSQESVGIDWVLVGGEVVKSPEGLRRQAAPGRPLRREVR